ncbi:unnamed protein product [Parascedosporium putredinis]|uniref:Uncharacterized protein n=1 Tax=Parascedosporium putredinis TaxID=1442378 RepID=A0A9P1MDY5_9PEZI|nr:unnamed protein product [Parascedosporium putredinis]CAI8003513.1 unnamed protein product [Parascedosporium putredinis]
MNKTPTGNKRNPAPAPQIVANGKGSPSRIPARVPLGNLKHGTNSPERRPDSRADGMGPARGTWVDESATPKMRDLIPAPTLETPANPYSSVGLGSIVRGWTRKTSMTTELRSATLGRRRPTLSGSENWETYDDNSEPEQDATDTYYAKVRAARIKRVEPESGHGPYSSQSKRPRGVPPSSHPHANHIMIDQDGNRIISASEWTDEDAF